MYDQRVVEVANSLHDLPHIASCQVLVYIVAEFHLYKLFKHGASNEGHDDKVSLTICEDVVGGAQLRVIREL